MARVVDIWACFACVRVAMATPALGELQLAQDASEAQDDDLVFTAFQEAGAGLLGFLIILIIARLSGWKPAWGEKKKKKQKQLGGVAAPAKARKARDLPAPPSSTEEKTPEQHSPTTAASRRLQAEANLLVANVVGGRVDHLPKILDGCLRRLSSLGVGPSVRKEFAAQLLLSAVRACASKRHFSAALGAYRQMVPNIGEPPCSLWSLLLWASVEANDYRETTLFVTKLRASPDCARGEQAQQDFVNIVRYCLHTKDLKAFAEILQEWRQGGFEMEVRTRNRALSLFTATDHALDFAAELIVQTPQVPLDAVAYNTLMRGYAVADKWPVCLQLYDQMRTDGITPSEITFGVLLDSGIKAGQLSQVKALFGDLRESGVVINVVHYTTFIKGLVAAGNLVDAREILNEMGQSKESLPDVITYSTLAKAYAEVGMVEGGISLLEMMKKQGLEPDGVLCNIILGSCCSKAFQRGEILRIFQRILGFGFVPGSSTLSVLIKACAKGGALTLAVETIAAAPAQFGWVPELRIYMQLGQALCTARMGQRILEVYDTMVRDMTEAQVNDATRLRFVRFCEECQVPPERLARLKNPSGQ